MRPRWSPWTTGPAHLVGPAEHERWRRPGGPRRSARRIAVDDTCASSRASRPSGPTRWWPQHLEARASRPSRSAARRCPGGCGRSGSPPPPPPTARSRQSTSTVLHELLRRLVGPRLVEVDHDRVSRRRWRPAARASGPRSVSSRGAESGRTTWAGMAVEGDHDRVEPVGGGPARVSDGDRRPGARGARRRRRRW